jgi:hypothetical protein
MSQRSASHERLPTVHSGIPGLTHRPSKSAAGRRQVVGDSEQGELTFYDNPVPHKQAKQVQ